ncbi:MAG: complex I NDUFA9 subunit family protein [Bacillota bacterium]
MILVTGGSGLVGRAVVKELTAKGLRVRCLVRDTVKARSVLGEGPEIAQGDVTNYESTLRAMKGVEGVVHLVAVIRERGAQTFERVNVEGTANAVRAAAVTGVRRFIHMSALGAKEGRAYPYSHSKWQAEEIVRKSGLNWTVIRPSLVYGPGFGFFNRMAQSIRFSPPPFAVYPAGRTRFQPIAAHDVARCVAAALKDPRFIHQTCDIGGPEHLTYREMLDIFLGIHRIRRIKLPVPVGLLRLVVPVMEKLLPDAPVSLVELKLMDFDNITDLDAVKKQFGFEPVRLREGLAETFHFAGNR